VSSKILSIIATKPLKKHLLITRTPGIDAEVHVKEEVLGAPEHYQIQGKTRIETEEKIKEPKIPDFPEIPENMKIPDNPDERMKLILDIYKAIFLSLTIGASRISGVPSTRGMIRKFLPFDKCPEILDGIRVEDNATINFDIIKKNLDKLPEEEREKILKENFDRIINSIIEGYGKVVGYVPLKGMTKREMEKVVKGYGRVMKKLGIAIPPEIIAS